MTNGERKNNYNLSDDDNNNKERNLVETPNMMIDDTPSGGVTIKTLVNDQPDNHYLTWVIIKNKNIAKNGGNESEAVDGDGVAPGKLRDSGPTQAFRYRKRDQRTRRK